MMIEVSPSQIMGLWEDLFRCVYGENRYGSYVAEIYIYRFMERDPYIELSGNRTSHAIEAFANANRKLYELCKLFEERVGVTLWLFEGADESPLPLDQLIATPLDPWSHRVHIGIQP